MSLCVCGSGLEFDQCCEPLLKGAAAPTAERLMRSRYAAYALGNVDHIKRTSAPEALDGFNELDTKRVMEQAEWLGLTVHKVTDGGAKDQTGIVDFTFGYKENGQDYFQHELASFRRDNGIWFYVDSDVNPKSEPVHVVQIGRNDPCPCGSGKKYKKCCGA